MAGRYRQGPRRRRVEAVALVGSGVVLLLVGLALAFTPFAFLALLLGGTCVALGARRQMSR